MDIDRSWLYVCICFSCGFFFSVFLSLIYAHFISAVRFVNISNEKHITSSILPNGAFSQGVSTKCDLISRNTYGQWHAKRLFIITVRVLVYGTPAPSKYLGPKNEQSKPRSAFELILTRYNENVDDDDEDGKRNGTPPK